MEFTTAKALIELAIVLAVMWFALVHRRTQSTLPLPPGPPAEFLLGHTRLIPKENTAATYARWAREYDSDIIHVKSLGRSIVVLNSVEAARDVLEKKGANFCDRPRFTLLEVNTNVRQWHKLQITEARRTVRNMMGKPSSWETSLRRLAVAIVLQVSYGTEVPKDDDPYIQIANDAMYATGNGGAPANSIVDLVPLGKARKNPHGPLYVVRVTHALSTARHLPDWIVRDWSLRFARQWRWAIQELHDVPFAAAQSEHDDRGDNKSLAHELLRQYRRNEENGQEQEWSLDDIKGAAGAVFIAGADTTWATCVIFILNMVLHPEIQEKARSQLDSVIGPDRLPNFSDRASLPYIEHIVQEIYRWSPLAPLGIPHKSLQDDGRSPGTALLRGTWESLISSRAVVYANAHAMAHDERIYRAPHDFNPDRYEPLVNGGAGEPFPVGNFGFGRRVCVGRFLADNSVWIMVATMLATLEFRKKMGPDGSPIEPRVQFTNGGTCHPEHFECDIRPRSHKAEVLIGANHD
ncbi:hypothetical protein NCS57_00243600 [Fusarium keratoplasticum]|uniref:Uncharacterized protein n=1 Tax=Fusarium keratoplasticum TaxID=1328300 RepID=A0ACC0R8B6_9HYPO|nr:hypothetical protein NCS57_00243600 [Fusarium keratoplasticum]KAI8679652.1 hypothetical protein NCS57_00243600 [Fusarium keratoplasticum]